MKEVYTGTIILPKAEMWTVTDLGHITYSVRKGNKSAVRVGADVRILGADSGISVEVTADDTELKTSPSSWYYDDYTPQAAGMRDLAFRLENGYYRLRCGGYVKADEVKELPGVLTPVTPVVSAVMSMAGKLTSVKLTAAENIPLDGYIKDGWFILTLYNVTGALPELKLNNNPLFTEIRTGKGDGVAYSASYEFRLADVSNFYGFEFSYSDDGVYVYFRNPQTLSGNAELPLEGKTIILDAGHGGYDIGAQGPDSERHESALNLSITLLAADKLKALGADVRLTRSDDTYVAVLPERLDYLNETEPDLAISVHQNSMEYDVNITTVKGLLGLYYSDAGKLLAECVSRSTAQALNRVERTPSVQRLAMVRNPKFPSTLIEVGFITCVEEVDLMMTDAGIEAAASGIVSGVLEYYKSQEKWVK